MTPDRAALALDAARVCLALAGIVVGLFAAAYALAWALDVDGWRSTSTDRRTRTGEEYPR